MFIWVRATLPRYRYDQLMRLGWKVLIPLAIANLVVTGVGCEAVGGGRGFGLIGWAEAIAFYFFAALHPRSSGVLVVTSQNPVHSVIFLVLDFLSVAGLYVALGAPFVAAIQVLVYAGGIVVLYLFVVMLVNVKRPPEAFSAPGRHSTLGLVLSGAVLLELVAIAVWSRLAPAPPVTVPEAFPVVGNTEQVGWLLYTSYLVPFEVASMLLLIAMIGAIVLARRES